MQPLAQLSRDLPDDMTNREIADYLGEKYHLSILPSQTAKVTFLDSFDWRLYAKSRLCFQQDKFIYLTDFTDKRQAQALQLPKTPPRFWWQFPESDIKQALAEILDVRALLPQVTFSRTTRELHILNKNEKVVALVLLSELDPGNQNRIHTVQLREVRGYNKWFMKLNRDLDQFGTPRPDTRVHTLTTAMAAVGQAPAEYSSGFSVALTPEMKSLAAAKTIYAHLLKTLQANEQGILDDLDSEFLHDFRVAIRRTRSALSLIKNVLDPEVCARFKDDFRYLGQITGPVRDLDVYLLMEENYKARLPEHLREGLLYFFADLAKQRSREHKKLVQALTGDHYRAVITDWQEYLESGEEENQGSNSREPTATLAEKIIKKRLKRIISDGAAIHPGTPDENLHRLRIQGKKLRYSLEFFSSLYPEHTMKTLIKQLKLLQNNLGDFNDLSVQQEMLKHYLAAIKPGTVKSKKLSAAIGGLLTNLYHEQRKVRTDFAETFARFTDPENLNTYRTLFTHD